MAQQKPSKKYSMKPNLTFSRLSIFPIVAVLSVIIIGISCQKSAVTEKQPSGNSSNQQNLDITNTVIEASASDEENFDMIMEDESVDASNVSNAKASKKTITYTPSKDVYPHIKVIDFGEGITDAKGVTKSGKVIITYYNAAAVVNGKFTQTTYSNYFVNGVHIEGSIQVNKIKNKKGQDVYVHTIQKTISDANGNVKDYHCNARWTVINWQNGINNAYKITSHTIGKETYNGIEASHFQTDVDEATPVIKPFTCKRVQGGLTAKIHLAQGNPNDLVEYLDFGNGDCDDIATLSVNGGTAQEVTLPLRFWPLNL